MASCSQDDHPSGLPPLTSDPVSIRCLGGLRRVGCQQRHHRDVIGATTAASARRSTARSLKVGCTTANCSVPGSTTWRGRHLALRLWSKTSVQYMIQAGVTYRLSPITLVRHASWSGQHHRSAHRLRRVWQRVRRRGTRLSAAAVRVCWWVGIRTGLLRFGARDYDPQSARGPPGGLNGNDTDVYVCAGNDPVNFLDASGLLFGCRTRPSPWGSTASCRESALPLPPARSSKLVRRESTDSRDGGAWRLEHNRCPRCWAGHYCGLLECCHPSPGIWRCFNMILQELFQAPSKVPI
jgi:hypothetical protein